MSSNLTRDTDFNIYVLRSSAVYDVLDDDRDGLIGQIKDQVCGACEVGLAVKDYGTRYHVLDKKTGRKVWLQFGSKTEEILKHYFDKYPGIEISLKR